jgi:hypothetical protein
MAVLRIRIRLLKFFGLLNPEPLVRGRDRDPDTDLAPDPYIFKTEDNVPAGKL